MEMQEYHKNSLNKTIKENDREIVNPKLYCSINKTIVELLITLCSSVISEVRSRSVFLPAVLRVISGNCLTTHNL